jgi:signal transduction histidine kinase/CheY-like chemotaxis protein
VSEAITVIVQLLFLAVFAGTAWSYARHRDPLSRDVMLVFASVAAIVVAGFIGDLVGGLPRWASVISIALLLAQPILVLRVYARTGDVSLRIWAGVLLAYAVTLAPFVVVAETEAWMVISAVAVFLAVEGIAAWFLARAGLQRIGSARLRLLIAAASTAMFGLSLLALGVAGALAEGGAVVRVIGLSLALLAAIGYALAFLPVAWLLRIWRTETAFDFTQSLIDGPAASADFVWTRLNETARAVSGASHVIVLLTGEHGTRAPIGTDALATDAAASELAAAAGSSRESPLGSWPRVADALGVSDRRAVLTALTFDSAPDGSGILAWITPRRSLFSDDDRDLLAILARRAAVFAERAVMMQAEASLNERLAATNDALQRASEAKSDFLASMSHELRTPLATVIGFSSLMRDEPGDGESVTVPREWVEHVHSSGEHLLGLINDVLDLSKVEAGRLELDLHRFNLGLAVSELVGGMRPLADRKGVALHADVGFLELTADRGRLRQVLYNLVSNAIKFTPSGGRVEISASRDGPEVRLVVADTGIGIAPDDHERVFREFQQVGDAEARQEGTGLGLALTRRLVEAHRGRIELDSAPGQGSRFTVVLPAEEIPAETDAAAPATAPTAGSAEPAMAADERDILLIEDDPSAVRLIRTYLEGAGQALRVAADGDAGLDEARRSPPGAILLDVLLPGRDGWDVLRELKADPGLRDVPVVIVSAVDERQLGLTLGAVDYFLKPVDREALLARLSRYTYTTKVRERSVRVLVVDDDPTALRMVEAALTPSGFDVVLAGTGREGVERAGEGGIDLVICDLLMPDLDGFEVVQRLRESDATADLPILILTAHDLSAADKQRLNGHILGVVTKDGDVPAELERWIRRAMLAARAAPGQR